MPNDRSGELSSKPTSPRCDWANFMQFQWQPPFWPSRFIIDDIFVDCMLHRSSKLPLKCGHDGLMIDAARMFVRGCTPYALAYFAERGVTLDWSKGDYQTLATEVATEMASNRNLPLRTMSRLKQLRSSLYKRNTELSKFGGKVYEWHPHLRQENRIWHVFDEFLEFEYEEPNETFIRTLDYIDHIKHMPAYLDLYPLKRDLTSYLRVARSVLPNWRQTGS